MSTLRRFLLERIREDEDAALAATQGEWTDQRITIDIDDSLSREDGAHIARHDPLRVLADCDALRAVLTDETFTYGERASGEPSIFQYRMMIYLAQPFASHPDFREEWAL